MSEHKKMPGTVGTVTEQSKDNIRIPQDFLQCKLDGTAEGMECVAASMYTMKNLCNIFCTYIVDCTNTNPKSIATLGDITPDIITMLDTICSIAENAQNEAQNHAERLRQLSKAVAE